MYAEDSVRAEEKVIKAPEVLKGGAQNLLPPALPLLVRHLEQEAKSKTKATRMLVLDLQKSRKNMYIKNPT